MQLPMSSSPKNYIKPTGVRKLAGCVGVYVLYRVIDLDWDFAWIVEPDLYFLNGAERTLERLQQFDHDLVATHLWPSGEHWMWGRALLDVLPDLRPHAMAFPF